MDGEKVTLVSSVDISGKETESRGQYGTLVNVSEPEPEIGKCKARWRRLFPTGSMAEVKEIVSLAWPIYLANVLSFVAGPISMIFSGHLGTDELASVAMATSLINVSGVTIIQGLSNACDTLFPQAFGGKNKTVLGVYLQRNTLHQHLARVGIDHSLNSLLINFQKTKGLIILALSCPPCWVIHLNAHQILLVLGQDPEVARLTGEYLLISIPGLLFTALQQALTKYLQIQGMLKPLILIGLLANGLNILMQYVLVYVLQMGIYGSALSQMISYLIMLVLTILYILIWKKYKATWPGWTWKCLENWGVFMKLAVSALFMAIFYGWIFEIGIFLSGLLGTIELGASSTLFQIQSVLFLLSFSLGASASIRVGYNLGAGNADSAMISSHVTFALSFLGFIVEAILLFSLMFVTPYIFTSDVSVAELTTSMIPIVGIILYFDSITSVSMGIIRGAGRQFIGAVINVSSYACIALPMVVVLMFVIKIGPAGFWWGIAIGQLPATIIYVIIVVRMNWKGEVDKVATRILRTDMVISVEVNDHDDVSNERSSLLDGRTSLVTSNTDGTASHLIQTPSPSTYPDEEETGADDITAVPESLSYLIWKRLSVLVVMMVILVAGILIRVFVPVIETGFNNGTLANSTDPLTTIDTVTEL